LLSHSAVKPNVRLPVGIVLNSFEPGGTERQMTELICRLDRRAFDVQVACLSRRGALHDRVAAAATVTEFPIRGLLSHGTAMQAARFAGWCRTHAIRVVHACDFYANVFALPSAAAARVPVRIGSRRDLFIPERTAAQQTLQRLSYRFAHRIVANSQAAASQLKLEGVPGSRICHIANGLDLKAYASRPSFTGPLTVTTVAHLRPGKGIDVLLEAAAVLLRRVPNVTFRIAGDGSLRQELEGRSGSLGVTGRVQFLGHATDVPALLRTSSIFAFPSLMEASPNAVIEAMAAGLAVVASNVGGIPEVVRHEYNGLLVPPSDAGALAAALERLITHPGLAERLGDEARETVARRFSFERMVSEFEQLYCNSTAPHGHGVPDSLDKLESESVQ